MKQKTLSDLQLVSTLRTLGINWDDTKKSGGHVEFIYRDNTEDVESAINSYYTGEMKVDPSELFSNYENIQTFIRHN